MAAEAKTKPTDVSVDDFIAAVPDPVRRADAEVVAALFAEVTGQRATLWGPSIVGFGAYHYVYDSGRQGDAPAIAFSPRKPHLVLYLHAGEARDALSPRLGKHKTEGGCIYVKRLSDVNMDVLRELAAVSYAAIKARYPD
ncbi:DUF1801 domain-containing protein [Brevundimonas goettingensis]|uniref:DUF1801 domain-containing protein n=1 Tax=Brevundimonas goettingensis TaxID=2774190 RepID=A0A975GXN1_9CAUL|nr:DUF1801 domain-containing protein [Brevundimonas goettingensis]QTC93054.1 DUF1801 domain-containing protein [Brevundimonas goettingensis]